MTAPNNDTLTFKKPANSWHQKFNVSLSVLIKSSISFIANASAGNLPGASKNVIDLRSSISKADLTDAEKAWLLNARAFSDAIAKLMYDVAPTIASESLDFDAINSVDPIENEEFSIDATFFSDPKNSQICKRMTEYLAYALEEMGVSENEKNTISNRLPSYFTQQLHQEWINRKSDYKGLESTFESPFFLASDKDFRWKSYNAWVQQTTQEPIFGEAFGLSELYVRLRCIVQENTRRTIRRNLDDPSVNQIEQNVADIESFLTSWLHEEGAEQKIKVVCGGPGSGKSTFLRIWANNVIEKGSEYQPLIIPLHHIDPTRPLHDEVGRFCMETGFLKHNPLSADEADRKILLLLDGLDELAMQGRIAQDIAQEFLLEVSNLVNIVNMKTERIKVVIGGRELVVQANRTFFRSDQQILTLLPYYLADEDRVIRWEHAQGSPTIARLNVPKKLDRDYRQDWWYQYGILTGKQYGGLPKALQREELLDITKQPLLNYLLALSFRRGAVDFRYESNINVIYEDLVLRVYQRGWAENRNVPVAALEYEQFVRVLEEVALAAWHGDGRKASLQEIEYKCRQGGLSGHLEAFESGAKKGVANLLMAFYFREADKRTDGEKTFEFTHKSFGEYLTALRLSRFLDILGDEVSRNVDNPDRGWSLKNALIQMANMFGPANLDIYIVKFLEREIQRKTDAQVEYIFRAIKCLVEHVVRASFPIDRVEDGPTDFEEKKRWVQRVETALIVVLHVVAKQRDEQIRIDWGGEWGAQRLLGKNLGYVSETSSGIIRYYLGYISFQGQRFETIDFSRAILFRNGFEECFFDHCNFLDADISDCTFYNAEFRYCNFIYARLNNCNFVYVLSVGLSMRNAYVAGCDFSVSDLSDLVADDLICMDTNFDDASLCFADLRYAIIAKCNFVKADLSYGSLRWARLFQCQYRKAKRVELDVDISLINDRHEISDTQKVIREARREKLREDIRSGGRIDRAYRKEQQIKKIVRTLKISR